MSVRITFKLKDTLAKIFKKEIEELDFDTSLLSTSEDVLQSYCSYTYRLIEKRKRTIHKADTFICPTGVEKGLNWLEEKIKKGESVNPHLNSAIKTDKLDGLLYDWGIHHLHLGESFSAPGYVKRTGPVLFAIFRKDDVYFIDIRDHEGWSDKNLLEIVNRNWPELLSIYKMEGVKPETSFDENDITSLRKSGVNTFHELSDGNSYLSMGGGITSAGTSMMAIRSYVKMVRMLNDIKTNIKANAKYLVSHVQPKDHPFRNRFEYVFVCRRYGNEIRFYDVVNNNYWSQVWIIKPLKDMYGV
jgi:hypothetical protein